MEHRFRAPRLPPAEHFRAPLCDPVVGAISITGRLRVPSPDATRLLVVVHGLGGSSASAYTMRAAVAAERLGWASLRLDLRGADRRGQDYYHAGLTADLEAALAAPALARFSRVLLLGYSLGGHLVLRYAAGGGEPVDPRVRAVASVCAPVDLASGARAIDRAPRNLYREHLMRGLKEIYREVARRRGPFVPLAPALADEIPTLWEWDDKIVAPRHGFDSAGDYYARVSVGPRLSAIALPTLFIATALDPMVLYEHVAPSLARADNLNQVVLERGGHIGFPAAVDLGTGIGPQPLERGLMEWLARFA